MLGEMSFRPRMGYMAFNIAMWIVLMVFWSFIMVSFLRYDGFGAFFIFYLVVIYCFPILFIVLFLVRIKYILRAESLLVRRYLNTIEIKYRSIRRVEEVTDRTVFLINLTPSVPSSKQIWIDYEDANGNERYVNISPAKKEEFLSQLRYRVDPKVFTMNR